MKAKELKEALKNVPDDAEVRRVVSYAVEKGYETEADIPSEELDQLLKGGAEWV